MKLRRHRGVPSLHQILFLAAAMLFGLPSTHAGTVILHTSISDVQLTGTGLVPLGPGLSEVQANFAITQSAAFESFGTTTIVVTPDALNPFAGTGSYSSNFTFQLDLLISPTTPGTFGGGLGDISIPAIELEPLTAQLTADFSYDFTVNNATSIEDFITITEPAPIVSTRTHDLGVDISGDGLNNSISFDALDINYLQEDQVSFEFDNQSGGLPIQDPISAIIGAAGALETIELEGTIAVAALGVQFNGQVNPAFTIDLDGAILPPAEVPLPAAVWLLGSAIGLGALRRAWQNRRRV